MLSESKRIMRTRVLLGGSLLSAVLGLLALDHFLSVRICISVLIVLLGLAGWCELALLCGVASRARGGGAALWATGFIATAYFLAVAWWEGATASSRPDLLAPGIAALLFAPFCCVVFRAEYEKRFQPLLMTILGGLLFGFLLSYLLRIYHQKDGILRGVVFLLGVKGNDIAAYLVGRAVGRIRFLKVSPKKTLEGCVAALVFSVIWFPGASWLWPESFFPWPWAIPLGIILSITTQVGDLSESLIKRCYQVKDSSSLIPEFGGILDLTDSVLFSGYLFWSVGAAALFPTH